MAEASALLQGRDIGLLVAPWVVATPSQDGIERMLQIRFPGERTSLPSLPLGPGAGWCQELKVLHPQVGPEPVKGKHY